MVFTPRGNPIPRLAIAAGALAFLLPGKMPADILYQVTLDTSGINLTSGFLDFDFAPGNHSQSALLEISGFSPGGSLSGPPQVNGGVSGTLPGILTIDNSTAFNDYFRGFHYGNTVGFLVTFGGPAITAPNGTATSGSTFGFGMFADAAGNNPLLTTDPNGNAFTVDVNLDGTTTLHNFSVNGAAQVTLVQAVPDPPAFSMLALALLGMLAAKRMAKHEGGARVGDKP